ncbi:alcohol dehydrogenase catalytic domain-containing protein [Propionispora vibrioides]|uniref:Alcohol dehydrogenase, propanol-preferring n=1 Tax=Propionispora vibrioides TaxID=112903 RepID=A0A1H8XQB7_9FIRM|nr:alcohol dehydrogenase catalytic domain-containing protein [Propionispora vibrioides]SEP42016.1 alcohol dehydrogenase, propanol-preferring [Propionispora vibrioides]
MLAAKILGKECIQVVEEAIPNPRKGEVLIRMKASALCRSDLHRYHGDNLFEDDDNSNITPGHEPCGIVEALGEGVTQVKIGDRVALYLGLGCRQCSHCLKGDIMLCRSFRCIGFAVNGAHADYMTIPEENCLLLPEKMDYITGALATDVGGTLYTACKRLHVDGTKTVVIVGCGPMGSGGILMAKGFGANVIAVDVDEKRLAMARSLGADYIINSSKEDPVKKIKELTEGGADAAIVCAGGTIPLATGLNGVKAKGCVGLIAESQNAAIDPSNQFIRTLVELKGCWYFNRSDWKEIADFIIRKEIPLKKISSHTFNISEATKAFPLFDSGQTQKVVFVWD